jgi:hypothetical protein
VRPAVGPFPVAGSEAGGWAVAGGGEDGGGGGYLFFPLSGGVVAVLSIPLLFFLLSYDWPNGHPSASPASRALALHPLGFFFPAPHLLAPHLGFLAASPPPY